MTVRIVHEQIDVAAGDLPLTDYTIVEVSFGCPATGAAVCTLVRLPDGREIHCPGEWPAVKERAAQ